MRTTGDHYPKMSIEKLCRTFDQSGKVVKNDESLTDQQQAQYTTKCIERSKYLDRTKLQNVDRETGYYTDEIIWTYDSLIIVKNPAKLKM